MQANRLPIHRGPRESFAADLAHRGLAPIQRGRIRTVQLNLGKRCNQACLHCHVDAGPKRTEAMDATAADRVVELLERSPGVETVDLTGGAPELNPSFRLLVEAAVGLGRAVIDRSNLTILLEEGQEDLADFLAAERVRIVASLPCYLEENVDRQRGSGVFAQSITAIRRLNELGYGLEASGLTLDLAYNPGGAFLPAPQAKLEAQYQRELKERFGLRFNRLLTMANVPVSRFALALEREGKLEEYHRTLVERFNPKTVDALMCRSTISVAFDGRLFDCDFNQMIELGLSGSGPRSIWELQSFDQLGVEPIATDTHCYACTAGSGSSCGGALTPPG